MLVNCQQYDKKGLSHCRVLHASLLTNTNGHLFHGQTSQLLDNVKMRCDGTLVTLAWYLVVSIIPATTYH